MTATGSERPHPIIDEEECKGCGRCVAACHKKVLKLADRLNRKAFTPAIYLGEGCTGCAICYYNCPEPYAIQVHNVAKEGTK